MKLVGPLAGGSPGLRLGLLVGLALEIERHCSADEILQGRLINFVAFVDVDGAADISIEAGVEETGGVRQCGSPREGELDDSFIGLSGADDAAM